MRFPNKLKRKEMRVFVKEAALAGVEVERHGFEKNFLCPDGQRMRYTAWGYGREWCLWAIENPK